MASRKPTFVLFDLGNVLVYIHPEAFLQTLGIDSPENRRYYQPLVIDIVKRYERGDDSTGEFFDRMDELFNRGRVPPESGPEGSARKFTREEFQREIPEAHVIFGSPVGFLGPVGRFAQKPFILADLALEGRRNLITGANKEDYHLRNVTPGRDFAVDAWADLRVVAEGEPCPNCGAPLKVAKAVEIGHIFKLGYKYAESLGARVLDKEGKEVTPIMGSYGIGIERILTAAIEQNHDQEGFFLPPQIAPFEVVVTPTNAADPLLGPTAREIAEKLEAAGCDVLLDDRDERPGVKFKDADLIGIPWRIIIGEKNLKEGLVEVKERKTGKVEKVKIEEAVEKIAKTLVLE